MQRAIGLTTRLSTNAMDRLSSNQIDKLGHQLRTIGATPADLEHLNAYRDAHQPAYDAVMTMLRRWTISRGVNSLLRDAELSGRSRKSARSVIAKLQRMPNTRLSQMQDIAGCRAVVPLATQQETLASLLWILHDDKPLPLGDSGVRLIHIDDRRERPISGYRAVHLLLEADGRIVEVQIRTVAQHLWASISEKLADVFGDAVKYGGEVPGKPNVRRALMALSDAIHYSEHSLAASRAFERWSDPSLEDPPALDELINQAQHAAESVHRSTYEAIRALSGLFEEFV